MDFPVRCFTCNKVLANRIETYNNSLINSAKKTHSITQIKTIQNAQTVF